MMPLLLDFSVDWYKETPKAESGGEEGFQAVNGSK